MTNFTGGGGGGGGLNIDTFESLLVPNHTAKCYESNLAYRFEYLLALVPSIILRKMAFFKPHPTSCRRMTPLMKRNDPRREMTPPFFPYYIVVAAGADTTTATCRTSTTPFSR